MDKTTKNTDWKKVLETALNHIDWKLIHCGCEFYRFVNNAGAETNIEFHDEYIKIKHNIIFGHSEKYPEYVSFGHIYFYLKDVDIKTDFENSLSFVGKNDNALFMTLIKVSDRFLKKSTLS